MSTTEARTAAEPEVRLTWDEICARYPDEWVVMTEIEENDDRFEIDGGLVLGHFKSRKEASPFIKAAFARYEEIGSFWTGKLIKDPMARLR